MPERGILRGLELITWGGGWTSSPFFKLLVCHKVFPKVKSGMGVGGWFAGFSPSFQTLSKKHALLRVTHRNAPSP